MWRRSELARWPASWTRRPGWPPAPSSATGTSGSGPFSHGVVRHAEELVALAAAEFNGHSALANQYFTYWGCDGSCPDIMR